MADNKDTSGRSGATGKGEQRPSDAPKDKPVIKPTGKLIVKGLKGDINKSGPPTEKRGTDK